MSKSITDTKLRNAKPRQALYRMACGRGLCLEVTPVGSKLWRYRYRFAKRAKMLALGEYPTVTLLAAGQARDAARELLLKGIDPGEQRKADKRVAETVRGNTFAALAESWFTKKKDEWAPATAAKVRAYLDSDLIPALGSRPISEIRRPELVSVLKRIEDRDALDVAKKCRQWLNGVFRYALVLGVIEINPATDLDIVARTAPERRKQPHIKEGELPAFLKALETHGGAYETYVAIRLLLLTAARPGELRGAHWDEFDLDSATWTIPAERMKMRARHVVPLPRQSVLILRELAKLTTGTSLVFPSRDDSDAAMSENTVNAAIKRIGYKGRQTGHGFRHLISTALNERGYNKDWVERQLAHCDNTMRGVYNGAEYLPQRRKMMQEWANCIDGFQRGSSKVTPLRAA